MSAAEHDLLDGWVRLTGLNWEKARSLAHAAMVFGSSEDVDCSIDWEDAPSGCALLRFAMADKVVELAVSGWEPSVRMSAREHFNRALQLFNLDPVCADHIETLRDSEETARLLRSRVARLAAAEDLETEVKARGRLCDAAMRFVETDPRNLRGAIPKSAEITIRVMAREAMGAH